LKKKVIQGIDTNLFSFFKWVFIGHYHDPATYKNKFQYVGASLAHDFGEKTGKGPVVVYSDLSTEVIGKDEILLNQFQTLKVQFKNIRSFLEEKKWEPLLKKGYKVKVELSGWREELEKLSKKSLELPSSIYLVKSYYKGKAEEENEDFEESLLLHETEEVPIYDKEGLILKYTEFALEEGINQFLGLKFLKEC